MTEEERLELKRIIAETVADTVGKSESPLCKIEGMRMNQLETIVQKLSIVVIGNGHVEDSLLWKENKNTENIAKITQLLERRKLNDEGERDQFKSLIRYLTDKILPSLITTAILGFIAYEVAVSKLLTP